MNENHLVTSSAKNQQKGMATMKKLVTVITCAICLVVISGCLPDSATISPPTQTSTITPASTTLTPRLTKTPTLHAKPVDTIAVSIACQLRIRGTYNFPKGSDSIFTLTPGKYLFYDKPGGGKYGNDQAGCELNEDCTKLRAINKDSAEPNPEGVLGSWVDSLTGTSTAQWHNFIVKCNLAPTK
jgi:hypothetical protein